MTNLVWIMVTLRQMNHPIILRIHLSPTRFNLQLPALPQREDQL